MSDELHWMRRSVLSLSRGIRHVMGMVLERRASTKPNEELCMTTLNGNSYYNWRSVYRFKIRDRGSLPLTLLVGVLLEMCEEAISTEFCQRIEAIKPLGCMPISLWRNSG